MARNRIFLTDDDDDDRLLIRAAIESVMEDVHVIEATSGEMLLGSLEEYSDPDHPSIVLMDMNMPVMTGLETLAKLRTVPRHSHVTVIMISTTTNEHLTRQCYELGVNAFLEKPILENEFKRLAHAVQLCLLYNNDPFMEQARAQVSGNMNIVLVGEDTRVLAEAIPAMQVSEVIFGTPDEILKQLSMVSWTTGNGPDLIFLVPGASHRHEAVNALSEIVRRIEGVQTQYVPILLLGQASLHAGEGLFLTSSTQRTPGSATAESYRWQPGRRP